MTCYLQSSGLRIGIRVTLLTSWCFRFRTCPKAYHYRQSARASVSYGGWVSNSVFDANALNCICTWHETDTLRLWPTPRTNACVQDLSSRSSCKLNLLQRMLFPPRSNLERFNTHNFIILVIHNGNRFAEEDTKDLTCEGIRQAILREITKYRAKERAAAPAAASTTLPAMPWFFPIAWQYRFQTRDL